MQFPPRYRLQERVLGSGWRSGFTGTDSLDLELRQCIMFSSSLLSQRVVQSFGVSSEAKLAQPPPRKSRVLLSKKTAFFETQHNELRPTQTSREILRGPEKR